jgi:Beta-ketoacyl synthase, N-terminal domain
VSEIFAVRGLGVRRGQQDGPADLGLLPRSLRRGLSEGMKIAIHVAGQALAGAGAAKAEIPVVFGSAVGETATAVELLGGILRAGESSPVLFRHSVHNAAPGILSIALGSLASSTAVAAGDDTLLAVFLEAGALLREGAPAVLAIVSEEGPSPVLSPDEVGPAGGVAFVLGASAAEADNYVTAPERGQAALSAKGPLAPAFALADALLGAGQNDGSAAIALSARSPWRVRVAAKRELLS